MYVKVIASKSIDVFGTQCTLKQDSPKPSPIPRMTRRKLRIAIDSPKNGVMKVDNDHMNTARDKITFPLYCLAAVAAITYKPHIPQMHILQCNITNMNISLKFNSNLLHKFR